MSFPWFRVTPATICKKSENKFEKNVLLLKKIWKKSKKNWKKFRKNRKKIDKRFLKDDENFLNFFERFEEKIEKTEKNWSYLVDIE